LIGPDGPHDGAPHQVWRERDPAGTLEEEWERIDGGDGRFFAARRGAALFVVAGNHWGYAEDCGERHLEGGSEGAATTAACYAVGTVQVALHASAHHSAVGTVQVATSPSSDSGTTVAWRVERCTDQQLEGSCLSLAGQSAVEWTLLPGCTLSWPPPGAQQGPLRAGEVQVGSFLWPPPRFRGVAQH
jgi:hypothetical protein